MSDPLLAVHHVGGRGGTSAFGAPKAFEADIVQYLYEADASNLPEMEAAAGGRVKNLPYCLGARAGRGKFRINMSPHTSSLLESNPDYRGFSRECAGVDMLVGETHRLEREIEVELTTVDAIVDGGVPCDVLSLDAQGAAYDILLGAERALRERVVCVIAEVEFHALYQDQKLFGDVSRFLSERGFHFAQFSAFRDLSPVRAKLGLRGKGFTAVAEAVFLRRVDATKDPVQLSKLAFLSLLFGHADYAFAAMEAAGGAFPVSAYGRLLQELAAAAARMPSALPKTFSQARSAVAAVAAAAPNDRRRIKDALASRPALLELSHGLVRAAKAAKAVVRSSRAKRTPVEAVLERWTLLELARLMREKRLSR